MIRIEELLDAVVRPAAWSWMQRRYLPAGPVCPSCSRTITGARALDAWNNLRKVYCAGCGHTFSAKAGTPIHETSWQPEEYVQCLCLAGAKRTPGQIAKAIGKSSACVRDMLERIRLRHPSCDSVLESLPEREG